MNEVIIDGQLFVCAREHKNFRPKDDEMRLHEYGRSGRPTLYSITLGSRLGIRRIRSKIRALDVMVEAFIDGRLFVVARSTMILDQRPMLCQNLRIAAPDVLFNRPLL